jgi:LysM repeat protein
MRRVAITAAVFVVAIIFAITTGHKTKVEALQTAHTNQTQSSTKKPKPHTVVVKSGDILSKIASANSTTMLRMFYANTTVKNPDLIYPGQKLRVPGANEKLTPRALPGEAANAPAAETDSSAPPASEASATPTPAAINGSVWDSLANCESGGNWAANTGNGFYGGLQFTLSSWQAAGGSGYPNQASRSEQIARAQSLLTSQGWSSWPACSAQLGLQ